MDADCFFAYVAKAGPLLTFLSTLMAASVAAGVTIYFGRVQVRIARQQAKTAAMAAATARNKLRLDLFERRMEYYDLVTKHMEAALNTGTSDPGDHIAFAMPFWRAVGGAKWLFDKSVSEWIDGELKDALEQLHDAQAAYLRSWVEDDIAAERPIHLIIAKTAAEQKVGLQFIRRDEVFGPFLHLTDE